MKIKQLLKKTEYELLQGNLETEITTLVYDSRKVEKGSVFVCISGSVRDAHDFIPDVIAKGAAAVVVEHEVVMDPSVTCIMVENSRLALANMAAAYFGYPAEKLKTIGITGTKGKTTTTYMVKSILEAAGIKTGLIGTIESVIGEEKIPSANTTPESYRVQELFAKMVEAGLDAVVMEVSSQALMLHRVSGFIFDIGVFTNLEPDHIGENEHKDFEDYMHCKSLLFQQCRHGIFNGDSEHLQGILKGHTCSVETFGFGNENDLVALNVELKKEHGALGVRYHVGGELDFDVEVNVPGSFSVYNSLTAIAICHHFGVEQEKIKQALSHVSVKGRIEIVPVTKRYTIMIDYAHNAMSLESLLTTLREYEPGRLVCLFGCGGNRAKSRRYEMGEVSSKLADLTVVTSDNPRNEEPMDIINDILVGVHKADGEYVTIPDRKEAIAYCMKNAKDGDIVVLAGKGHEDYQEIKGVKHHMDERELIAEIIRENPELEL
ncbi:MAG: UDP-N-acetylmuramoyl-L-alanyl-D-glutamate--2,6-diaminopimelate ligase [Lachnospiraceae bacterium]|nr:UDP-N-acetylmuramoyl-L-alanyl-D-glutamate--2,6-diaminopimelate ligase [Lachnospiraceae bacterium]